MDCLAKIQKWRNGGEILCDFGLVVFNREGYDNDGILASAYKKYPDNKIFNIPVAPREISSTEIRRRMADGEDYSDLVPEELTQEELEEIIKSAEDYE